MVIPGAGRLSSRPLMPNHLTYFAVQTIERDIKQSTLFFSVFQNLHTFVTFTSIPMILHGITCNKKPII